MSQPRLAFDIETVSPTVPHDEMPDFDDPTDFELLAVGLGYQPAPGGGIERDVLFRDGWGEDAEATLLNDVAAWLDERATDNARLLTYNGDGFDIPITHGRGRILSQSTGDEGPLAAFRSVVDHVEHVDIKPDAWNAFGTYTKLEETCEYCGCPPTDTILSEYDCGVSPEDVGLRAGEPIDNGTIPRLGELYLNRCDEGADRAGLREALYDYTVADIEPLFVLDDRRPFEDVATL